MGSEAIFTCSVRSLQHKLSVAERLSPLKREQLHDGAVPRLARLSIDKAIQHIAKHGKFPDWERLVLGDDTEH